MRIEINAATGMNVDITVSHEGLRASGIVQYDQKSYWLNTMSEKKFLCYSKVGLAEAIKRGLRELGNKIDVRL